MVPITYTLYNIHKVANWLWEQLQLHPIITLHAPMGAGKTTLVAHVIACAGSTDAVSSPTYALMNQYLLPQHKKLWHMDWYRIADEEEAIQAGIEDALYSGDFCIIEWPEKAAGILPEDCLQLEITILSETERSIKIM